MPITTCKNCQRNFRATHNGALYCSGSCRTNAYRKRQAKPEEIFW